MRLANVQEDQSAWKTQIKDVEKQIEDLLDRLLETENRTVMKKLEERIDTLERQKIVLAEPLARPAPKKQEMEDCIELSLKFLSSLWYIYENGNHAMK